MKKTSATRPSTKLASMWRSVRSAGYRKLYRWKIHLFRLAMIMLSTNQLPMHASLVSVRPGRSSSRLRPRGVSSGSIASPLPSELPAPGVRCIQQAVRTGGASSLDGTLHEASVEVGGGGAGRRKRRMRMRKRMRPQVWMSFLPPESGST